MALVDFLRSIDSDVRTVVASDFKIEIVETNFVPDFDDPAITYDNVDDKVKRCKLLESCVLYVDIRNSASISVSKYPHTLARMYSSFVRSMIAAARYHNGHVRNIIGDRVMVVFDKKNCFSNAVDTAVLMNTISQRIINKHVKALDFKCGIGIDYGKMLIAKGGKIRKGAETEFYRSLVWLGRPANIASRLTDVANKQIISYKEEISEGYHYPTISKFEWLRKTYSQFIDNLEDTGSGNIKHKSEYFFAFIKMPPIPEVTNFAPILITEDVYKGLAIEKPNDPIITKGWWKKQPTNIKEYKGIVYGGDLIKDAINQI